MDNFSNILKLKGMWDSFVREHPRFPQFLTAMKNKGVRVDSIIDLTITDSDGTRISTNIKVTESDIELFNTLMSIGRKQ